MFIILTTQIGLETTTGKKNVHLYLCLFINNKHGPASELEELHCIQL
jgi:hypothetical protein